MSDRKKSGKHDEALDKEWAKNWGKSAADSGRGKSYQRSRTERRVGPRTDVQESSTKSSSYKDKPDKRESASKSEKSIKKDIQAELSKKDIELVHDPKREKEVKKSGQTAADLEEKWRLEAEKKKEEEALLEEERQKNEEEEKERREEEKKRQEIEEENRKIEEEKKLLDEYISDHSQKNRTKVELRETNLNAEDSRPSEASFSKLDSSLKKNTAFVKKIKNLTEAQKDQLTKDIKTLNLTKYIGEVATSIVEAKMKMSDVPCAVHVCSLLHQRYADCVSNLLESWQKVLPNKKDEKIQNPSKLRVDLRFFAELISVGVLTEKEGLGTLANQLSLLTTNDKEEHNNLSVIMSFCRHCGNDYAGLVPRKIRLLAEKYDRPLPESHILPAERQKACRNLVKEYYVALVKHVMKDHKALKRMEKANRKILRTKGELSAGKHEVHESALLAYQKLHANTVILADLLDEDLPDLPEEKFEDDEMMGLDVYHPDSGDMQVDGNALFEDEDSRSFYERFPDLKQLIPAILYKDSAGPVPEETPAEVPAETEDELKIEDVEKEMEELKIDSESPGGQNQQRESSKEKDEIVIVEDVDEETPDFDIPDEDTDMTIKLQLEAFLLKLPHCVNRDLIDTAAVDFCMKFNTKVNRRKLIKALFSVHRTRYDLLPFYSRLVAILHPCMPDISLDLSQFLKNDFKWHVRKKDQINIESKLKTVRFIGELVKFRMYPKADALHCVKMLLFDFMHHNIEMVCGLLESCGRFLYRSPDSHLRTRVYLDVMMRKKAALHLDNRYTAMIENAYYYSNPPDVPQIARKVRPPVHEYIRKLLYKELSKLTTEKVLRQIRKLDWDDESLTFYVIKCLIGVWNMRYNNIHCAANLLAGLAKYYEHIAIQVVDSLIEDIRIGMEINHPKYNQRRVSQSKFLGELYNYRMVDSSVIFKTLYSFITFGVSLDENMPLDFDPPEHLFRLRLVCILLDTCGQYFDRGSSKKKLDCFLGYFQRYYFFKKKSPVWNENQPFPIDVEYMFRDYIDSIKPKHKMCENFEEACKNVEEIESGLKKKFASVLSKFQETTDDEQSDMEGGGLHTIKEEDEKGADELSQGLSQTHLQSDEVNTVDSEDDGYHQGPSQNRSQSQGVDSEEENDLSESEGGAGEQNDIEDELNIMSGGPKLLNCTEDEDFMAALDKLMLDSVHSRTQESVKVPQLDVAVPMHLKGQTRGKYGPGESTLNEESGTINFVLMTKRGNKQQYSSLNVPISAEFAAKYKQREEAERAEKERMKRLTLDINERQEEEDYIDLVSTLSRPAIVTVSVPRERKTKFQHQKGVPDVDKIFK